MTTLGAPQIDYPGATTGTIVGEYFYIIGGNDGATGHLDAVRIVPISGNGVPELGSPIPTPRGNLVVAAVNDHIYAVAGLLPLAEEKHDFPCAVVEVFNTSTGRWQSCAPLPAQRVKPGLTAVGNTLYALGGREDQIDADTIFAYDTFEERWDEVGRLPYGARHGSACTADGLVYYSGGFTGLSKTFHQKLVVFDPKTGEVKQRAEMPAPRTAHAFVACKGSLYVLGGVDTEKKPTATVFKYDIAADQWSESRPLASDRAMFACGVAGNEIIVAGGWKRLHKEANSSVERYPV